MAKLVQNPYSGFFIAFEGSDGSGKSTQSSLLAAALKKEEYAVLATFEPTKDYRFGTLVRSIYTSHDPAATLPSSLQQFFADEGYYVFRRHLERSQKSYIEHFERIAHDLSHGVLGELPHFIQLCMTFDRYDHRTRMETPALKEGTHIVSDRDFYSTLAYGASEGIPFQTLLDMQKNILGTHAFVPDLIYILDVPAEVAKTRMELSRTSKDRFDDHLEEVNRAYREIMQNPELNRLSTVVAIDGSLSQDTIHQLVMRAIKQLFRQN